MKILVTGGRGFIGSHLIPALKEKGHTARSYDSKDGKDILDKKQLLPAVAWSDVVYHLAALTDVQESFVKEKKYTQVNEAGTKCVVRACLVHNKKIIFSSTAATYYFFSSPYARTKGIGELFVSDIHTAVILRLFNVYGDGMKQTTMLARFQKENPITIYGDGTQTRDFIHIDDVVKIMEECLLPKWDGFIGDVGTGEERSVLSVAKQFKKQIIHREKRPEIERSVADITELRKLYSKPFKKLEDYVCKLPR